MVEQWNSAKKVFELRGQLQITQMQLAELLGDSYSAVNRWENGQYKATKLVMHKFEKLCEKHRITFDDTKAEGKSWKA